MSSELVEIKDLDLVAENGDESKAAAEIVDYKMVTFSLGGKDYGIDIMKVKEISKASKFTYVPNSIPFVKGVYNLRGDIISVIDLRLMFNLPVPESTGIENMIILRLEENTIGVIVDTIDKVVGISSAKIQPPHPLFGDINIKFIKGIVENQDRLYIILDVESVFDQDAAETAMQNGMLNRSAARQTPVSDVSLPETAKKQEDINHSFISETLSSLGLFFVSSINDSWIRKRLESWSAQRKGKGQSVQLENAADANEFLTGFTSPYTGHFWEHDYADEFIKLLPDSFNGLYSLWNVGCGKGEETYSVACALKKKNPSGKIKIYANDADLLNVSTAPNLIFSKNTVPEIYDPYITEGRNGWHFATEIKDLILFEYHDVTQNNQLPPVDLIIARDVLSYLNVENQQKLIDIFYEKLKPGGILIIGANEILAGNGWEAVNKCRIPAYKKI